MFVVFPKVCDRTHTHTQTDTQYHYHTLLPMLHVDGNYYSELIKHYFVFSFQLAVDLMKQQDADIGGFRPRITRAGLGTSSNRKTN